jgi:hypothetical protein
MGFETWTHFSICNGRSQNSVSTPSLLFWSDYYMLEKEGERIEIMSTQITQWLWGKEKGY